MATNLEVIGPIDVPFQKQQTGSAKHIGKDEVARFWKDLAAHSISAKNGCYVFALRASKGFQPWYVGKATKGMKQECLQAHKLTHYNHVLFKGRKGTPVLFFVVPGGNLKKVPKKVVDELETFLIQSALSKNPKLSNVQKTKLPVWTVKGVIRGGQGKPSATHKQFRTLMGIRQ